MVTALTAQGMTIMCLFVVQVIVSTTYGDIQFRNHQLLLAAQNFLFTKKNFQRIPSCKLLDATDDICLPKLFV